MFGMGGSEILLVGIVALIVVGPKELPGLFRSVGQFVGKARGMAREFTRAMEDAADQSGMKDATNAFKGLSNPKKYGLDKVKEAADPLKWKPASETSKLAGERAEAAKKIHDATAKAAQTRLDTEAASKTAAGTTSSTPLAVPELPKAATKPAAKPAVSARPVDDVAAAPVSQGLRQTAGQRASGTASKPQPRSRGAKGASPRRPLRKG